MKIDKALQLACKYYQAGNLQESGNLYKKILKANPYNIDALHFLGVIYYQLGDYNNAIKYLKKEIQITPSNAGAYNDLGIIFQEEGRIDEAIKYYQKALHLNPDLAEAHSNLGTAFKEKDNFDEAIICYQKALQKKPYFADVYNNLGVVLQNKGQFEEAIQYFQKALQIEPDHAKSHWSLSFSLLLLGNFDQGLKEYEWRWKTKDFVTQQRRYSRSLWDGSDISGKSILIYPEQGIGDIIQFIRYIPLVAQRGAKVFFECPKELVSLLKNLRGMEQMIIFGENLPEFDIYCPLLSLPLIFKTTLNSIPAEIPYIKVDSSLMQKWKEKFYYNNYEFKVGLAWTGNPKNIRDHYRSISLEIFKPLAQCDNVIFYSLQKGKAAEQAKNPPEGMKLIDYTDEINDFSDTAALIENLDLVISVDTAVAHLAGAMGKPVWTLIPFSLPDWRWMLDREDSPWYPTMRLFRQPSYGDWKSVIEQVKEELKKRS
jgi:Flp pilus assembly protein TadD